MDNRAGHRDHPTATPLLAAAIIVGLLLCLGLRTTPPSVSAAGPGMAVTDAYVPAGYMGDTNGITIDETNTTVMRVPGTPSVRVTYQPGPVGWAGVYWLRVSGKLPQGNWGDAPGLDLRWAPSLTFWARGQNGGERVEFKSGGIQDPTKPFHDSYAVTLGMITLSQTWQQYTLDFTGLDMSSGLGAFAWAARGADNPGGLTFYLSELTFQGTPPDWAPPLPITPTPTPTPPATISDGAYADIHNRVTADRQSMFLYKDDGSGFNHGFPSGWFGSSPGIVQQLSLNAACIDDPASSTGCSTSVTSLDRQRGTVLSISFPPLATKEFVGVNVVEPDRWDANQPQPGVGYDLRGASRVIFDVRSPTPGGVKVQFGVGMNTTPFMLIPQSATYSTRYVSLDTLNLSPTDLSSVHVLFTVVTNHVNAPNGGTILLDNIRFDPVPVAQQGVLSLPLSTQTYGVVPVQSPQPPPVPIPPDQVNRTISATYESAMTLIALLNRGTPQDLADARLIAEAFHYALGHDNHGDPLPSAPGAFGLRSGYSSGDLTLLNDQAPPGAGRAGDVRLAGFSAGTSTCGASGTCLVLAGATGGNAALAALGLLSTYLHPQGGDSRYLQDAETIGRWIEAELTDRSGTGFGGYFLGYPDDGSSMTLIKTKSTENNADIFAMYTALATAETRLGNTAQADVWTRDAAVAGDFVMAMFDDQSGCFNAGALPLPVPSPLPPGIKPGGAPRGNEIANVYPFLDSETFTTLAMAHSARYGHAIDWRRPVRCMAQFGQTVTTQNQTFSGFSITQAPTGGPNGISWEFTGQAVAAMALVARQYNDHSFDSYITFYASQIHHAQLDDPFTDGLGLVAATLQDETLLPPYGQCLSTPFQCFPARPGLAATTWAIFADHQINPMQGVLVLACTPRPDLLVSAVPDGAGGLQTTLTETGLGALLRTLRIDQGANGVITWPGHPIPVPGPGTIDLGGVVQFTFTVRQQTAGLPTTVQFTVMDDCPTGWPSFVGGGPAVFGPATGAAAAPTPASGGAGPTPVTSGGQSDAPTPTVRSVNPPTSSSRAVSAASPPTGGQSHAAPPSSQSQPSRVPPLAGSTTAPGRAIDGQANTARQPPLASPVATAGPVAPTDTTPPPSDTAVDAGPAPNLPADCAQPSTDPVQTTIDPAVGGSLGSVDGALTIVVPPGEPDALTLTLTPAVGAGGGNLHVGDQTYTLVVNDSGGNAMTSFAPPLTLTLRPSPCAPQGNATTWSDVAVSALDPATSTFDSLTLSTDDEAAVATTSLAQLGPQVTTSAPPAADGADD